MIRGRRNRAPAYAAWPACLSGSGRAFRRPKFLNPDGKVNRARLAEPAFGAGSGRSVADSGTEPDRSSRRDPESGRVDGRCGPDAIPHAIAMVEAALILEAGAWERFDRIVVVTCRAEQRIERWAGAESGWKRARREVSGGWPPNYRTKRRSKSRLCDRQLRLARGNQLQVAAISEKLQNESQTWQSAEDRCRLRSVQIETRNKMKLLRLFFLAMILAGAFFYFTTYRSGRMQIPPAWLSRPTTSWKSPKLPPPSPSMPKSRTTSGLSQEYRFGREHHFAGRAFDFFYGAGAARRARDRASLSIKKATSLPTTT